MTEANCIKLHVASVAKFIRCLMATIKLSKH